MLSGVPNFPNRTNPLIQGHIHNGPFMSMDHPHMVNLWSDPQPQTPPDSDILFVTYHLEVWPCIRHLFKKNKNSV